MGPSHLSATRALIPALVAVAIAAAAPMRAQGPVYRERWGYLHLERLRCELLRELRGRDPATVARIAEWLVEPDRGVPFVPVARAIASLRGVPADDLYLLRSMLSAYVLPEVADPDGRNEVCRRTNVSLFLPFATALPDDLVFDVEVRDAAGERVWSARLGESPTLEDLRMARLVAPIPAGELADGSYRVVLRARVGAADPGPKDPVLQWPFHVLRGYQDRCEAAFLAVDERATALAELPRALLRGCAMAVQRAYLGEAFDVESDAVHDLLRLEQALANVAADRHPLAGMTGDVPVLLPSAAPRGLSAVLRVPDGFEPGAARGRPLVVFAAATPAYDPTLRRPTSPSSRGPGWTAHELATFGRDLDCDVACLESPGELRDYIGELCAALPALRQVFGTGAAPLVLVADGEAATITAFHVARLRPELQGLVLVGAGAMNGPVLDGLGALPVRMQPVPGAPGSEGLQRSLDYVAQRSAAGEWRGDVARLCEREVPWQLALPLLAAEIEAFAARVFGRPAAPK
ncbi:MAG: hypothetical protein JNM25_05280 [Planctomycetes bacterium]|nr:hypothetical protein [Planctomycetota bacterium]